MQQLKLRTLLLELHAAHVEAEGYCALSVREQERLDKRINALEDDQARLRDKLEDRDSALRESRQVLHALSQERDQLLVSYLEAKNLLTRHTSQEPLLRADLARSAQHIADVEGKLAEKDRKFEKAHRFWIRNQPKEVTVSTQDDVLGGSWHYAEHDGRWTGPELVSSLKLPSLAPGRYLVTVGIVDAMSSEICSHLRIDINGQTVGLTRNRLKLPFIISTEYHCEQYPHGTDWEVTLTLPEVRSPAERGSEDARRLGVKVAWMKFNRIR